MPQNMSGYTDLIPPLMNHEPWSSYPLGQWPTGDVWQCPLPEKEGPLWLVVPKERRQGRWARMVTGINVITLDKK